MMEWAASPYLWMLGLVPLVVGLFAWARRRRHAAYAHGLLPERVRRAMPRRRLIQGGVLTVAVVALVLGLARPRTGGAEREVEQRGLDLAIVLDVSRSMQAEDVAPTRLDRVRSALNGVLDALAGDRVSLVVFAGTGLVQAPLTTDYAALRALLDAADPRAMPTPGSNLEAALDAALSTLNAANDPASPTALPHARAVLVLSDGEFHAGSADAARAQADAQNVALFAAGVGTAAGARVPMYNDRGVRTDWLRDDRGAVVTTRLDAAAMQALPTARGRYYEIGATAGPLAAFIDDLRGLERSFIGVERFETYREGFWIPLAVALLLLTLDAVWDPARRALLAESLSA